MTVYSHGLVNPPSPPPVVLQQPHHNPNLPYYQPIASDQRAASTTCVTSSLSSVSYQLSPNSSAGTPLFQPLADLASVESVRQESNHSSALSSFSSTTVTMVNDHPYSSFSTGSGHPNVTARSSKPAIQSTYPPAYHHVYPSLPESKRPLEEYHQYCSTNSAYPVPYGEESHLTRGLPTPGVHLHHPVTDYTQNGPSRPISTLAGGGSGESSTGGNDFVSNASLDNVASRSSASYLRRNYSYDSLASRPGYPPSSHHQAYRSAKPQTASSKRSSFRDPQPLYSVAEDMHRSSVRNKHVNSGATADPQRVTLPPLLSDSNLSRAVSAHAYPLPFSRHRLEGHQITNVFPSADQLSYKNVAPAVPTAAMYDTGPPTGLTGSTVLPPLANGVNLPDAAFVPRPYDAAYGHFATTAAQGMQPWVNMAAYMPGFNMLQPPVVQYLPTFHHAGMDGRYPHEPAQHYQPLMLPPPSPNILSYYSYDPYQAAVRFNPYKLQSRHVEYYDYRDSASQCTALAPLEASLLTQNVSATGLTGVQGSQLVNPVLPSANVEGTWPSHPQAQSLYPPVPQVVPMDNVSKFDPTPGAGIDQHTSYYYNHGGTHNSGGLPAQPMVIGEGANGVGGTVGTVAVNGGYNNMSAVVVAAAAAVAAAANSPLGQPIPGGNTSGGGYGMLLPNVLATANLPATHNPYAVPSGLSNLATAGRTANSLQQLPSQLGLPGGLANLHLTTAQHVCPPVVDNIPKLPGPSSLLASNYKVGGEVTLPDDGATITLGSNTHMMDWTHSQMGVSTPSTLDYTHLLPGSLTGLSQGLVGSGANLGLGIDLGGASAALMAGAQTTAAMPLSSLAPCLPGTHVTLMEAQQESIRDQCLSHAHSLYSNDPRSDTLVAMLQALHKLHPTHLPTLLLLACVYFSRNEPQLSLHYNHLILGIDPNYVEAMSNIGTTLRSIGRSAEAEQYWWKAVKHRPGYWDAVENLLGVLCNQTSNSTASGNDTDRAKSDGDTGGNPSRKDQRRTATTSASVGDITNAAGTETSSGLLVNEAISAKTSEGSGPRYSEALKVCNYVEKHMVRSVSHAATTQRPMLCHHVPNHQLHRLQNLYFVKGNLKFALGDLPGSQEEYYKALDVILSCEFSIEQLVVRVVEFGLQHGFCVNPDKAPAHNTSHHGMGRSSLVFHDLPIVLIEPSQAVQLRQYLFPETNGILPSLATHADNTGHNTKPVSQSALQQAKQTTSTVLLTLAKLFQDHNLVPQPLSVVLPLHYLSLALNPSPSTCNNLGIYLNNIPTPPTQIVLPGVSSGGVTATASMGVAYALQYYTYGLALDPQHPHLYTNLGSLFKDMGYLNEAVKMYEKAVEFNPKFDVAYANLGNAIKDMGRVQDSIQYYVRAVERNPDFVDALCGMANALSGVCDWRARTGFRSRILPVPPEVTRPGHVDEMTLKLYRVVGCNPKTKLNNNKVPPTVVVETDHPDFGGRGWMDKVVSIVSHQLRISKQWGKGTLLTPMIMDVMSPLSGPTTPLETFLDTILLGFGSQESGAVPIRCKLHFWRQLLIKRRAEPLTATEQDILRFLNSTIINEGGWCVRVVERCMRWIQRRWYVDRYHRGEVVESPKEINRRYARPMLPPLPTPHVPTVLPFHTFTYPLSARQIRLISHRNALRISHSVLSAPWLPNTVYHPPPPPAPHIRLGYVSSDFNNHPLSHLMQSVFGFHDRSRFQVYCYATTPSDNSVFRHKIEGESDHFLDVSSWSVQAIIDRILQDGIHILINLNGYTKGARNEIFAARPTPVQVSYMGFAGTLGAQWTDWFVTDPIVCPRSTVQAESWYLRQENDSGGPPSTPRRTTPATTSVSPEWVRSLDEGELDPEESDDHWVYTEKMIYMPHSYFVDDHRQGFREKDEGIAPHLSGAHTMGNLTREQREQRWLYEQDRRWAMRREIFPQIPEDWCIFANFNQLYKIDPIIFKYWLQILVRVPKSVIWLLNFPAAGKEHLTRTALQWEADPTVAQRVIFTDVAPKEVHIHRGRVADLFLDTPECNGHTTAVDILWSGTPMVTWPRNYHKLCSRVAASVVLATGVGEQMVVNTGEEYVDLAVHWANTLRYEYIARVSQPPPVMTTVSVKDNHFTSLASQYHRVGHGPLMEIRKQLFLFRDSNRLFDTPRWTRNLEKGYEEAWRRWESGEEFWYTSEELRNLEPSVVGVDPTLSAGTNSAVKTTCGANAKSRGSIFVQDDDDGAFSTAFSAKLTI
ncbi:hypothetical protein IWQ61_001115 [Dispira simplex]|nr:hypothetical protein IWQ61_001115 [Dispira simplex]